MVIPEEGRIITTPEESDAMKADSAKPISLEKGDRLAVLRSMLPRLLTIVLVVFVLDQVSKQVVVQSLRLHQEVEVIAGVFNLTLVYNKGVAFGMGSGLAEGTRQLILAFATLIAVLAVIYFLFVDYLYDRRAQCAIALILGGALGNVVDRVFIGSVVDFLDFYWGTYHWPAFNIADSAIFCGVILLIFSHPQSSTKDDLPSQAS
jgi:signal peptidase II